MLISLILYNYPSLATASLKLIFKHFSQKRETTQTLKQVGGCCWKGLLPLYAVVWNSMQLYGFLYSCMGFYAVVWNSKKLYGVVWKFMDLYRVLCECIEV